MKNFINNHITPAVIVVGILFIVMVFGWTVLNWFGDKVELGSVIQGSEYHATSTLAFGSDSTLVMAASEQGTAVILGSVVIASTTPYWTTIYDATSTAAVTVGVYSTKIVTFPVSAPRGTYTFDISLQDGLVITNETGHDGEYVITYR